MAITKLQRLTHHVELARSNTARAQRIIDALSSRKRPPEEVRALAGLRSRLDAIAAEMDAARDLLAEKQAGRRRRKQP